MASLSFNQTDLSQCLCSMVCWFLRHKIMLKRSKNRFHRKLFEQLDNLKDSLTVFHMCPKDIIFRFFIKLELEFELWTMSNITMVTHVSKEERKREVSGLPGTGYHHGPGPTQCSGRHQTKAPARLVFRFSHSSKQPTKHWSNISDPWRNLRSVYTLSCMREVERASIKDLNQENFFHILWLFILWNFK